MAHTCLTWVGIGAGHSTTGALEGGQVGQLLNRHDERVQPVHVSVVADRVIRQAVTQQSSNRVGVLNVTDEFVPEPDVTRWEGRASTPQGLQVRAMR